MSNKGKQIQLLTLIAELFREFDLPPMLQSMVIVKARKLADDEVDEVFDKAERFGVFIVDRVRQIRGRRLGDATLEDGAATDTRRAGLLCGDDAEREDDAGARADWPN
jgi:hypothetical protein